MKNLILAAILAALVTSAAAQSQPLTATASGAGSASVQSGQAEADASAGASTRPNGSDVNANAGASTRAGSAVEAELTKGLDARKAKPGDPVMAKCTREMKGKGDFRIPKNAKLIGHVTEAQARGRGQGESSLGITFEKAQLKDGREIPLQAVIQAIAPSESVAMDMGSMASANESANVSGESARTGGPLGNATSAVNSATSTTASAAGNLGSNVVSSAGNVGTQAGAATMQQLGGSAGSSLNAASTGVIGLKGLQLESAATGAAQGSVIRSSSDNVRLESGTRLVLRLIAQ